MERDKTILTKILGIYPVWLQNVYFNIENLLFFIYKIMSAFQTIVYY